MTLRAFIIEDEPPARARLRALLGNEPEVEIAGESDGGPECLTQLRTAAPDVVFLDLHLPGINGFELLNQAQIEPLPAIVVITAYSNHAVEGFEQRVTDYLLKPCRPERLHEAIMRVQEQATARATTRPGPKATPPVSNRLVRFVVRNEHQFDVVPAAQVDWLGAAGNYVVLHKGRETHVLRESLSTLEDRLDPAQFVRISRAALVNVDCIKSVVSATSGNTGVVLRDGTTLPLTRGMRELQARLERG